MAADTGCSPPAEVDAGDELPALAYDVTATTVVLGALAARDWRPMHHDHDFAVNRNGTQDIFMNTPNQAAWFERYLTDWTGPKGRLGRMKFRMKGSVFPGDTMVFRGTVTGSRPTTPACGWATVEVERERRRRHQDRVHGPRRPADRRRRQPLDPPRRRMASLIQERRWISSSPTSRRCSARRCGGSAAAYAPLEVVREMEDDPVGYPAELWKQLGALDLIGLTLPEATAVPG